MVCGGDWRWDKWDTGMYVCMCMPVAVRVSGVVCSSDGGRVPTTSTEYIMEFIGSGLGARREGQGRFSK